MKVFAPITYLLSLFAALYWRARTRVSIWRDNWGYKPPPVYRSARSVRRRRVDHTRRLRRRFGKPTNKRARHTRSGYGSKLARRVIRPHYKAMSVRTPRASKRGRRFAYWVAERFAAFRLGCLRKNRVLKKLEKPRVRFETHRRRQRALGKGPCVVPLTRAQRKAGVRPPRRPLIGEPLPVIDDDTAPRGDL